MDWPTYRATQYGTALVIATLAVALAAPIDSPVWSVAVAIVALIPAGWVAWSASRVPGKLWDEWRDDLAKKRADEFAEFASYVQLAYKRHGAPKGFPNWVDVSHVAPWPVHLPLPNKLSLAQWRNVQESALSDSEAGKIAISVARSIYPDCGCDFGRTAERSHIPTESFQSFHRIRGTLRHFFDAWGSRVQQSPEFVKFVQKEGTSHRHVLVTVAYLEIALAEALCTREEMADDGGFWLLGENWDRHFVLETTPSALP